MGIDYNPGSVTGGGLAVSAAKIQADNFGGPGVAGHFLILYIDGDLRRTTSGTLAIDTAGINQSIELLGGTTRVVNDGGTISAAVIPEPSSLALLVAGGGLTVGWFLRKQQRQSLIAKSGPAAGA